MRPPLDFTSLARDCRFEAFRGPGPGGQKRNKTSSAVRVVHVPTGVSVTAAESRSQTENRELATGRLRLRIALEVRNPIPFDGPAVPDWFSNRIADNGRLRLTKKDDQYPDVVGIVFDVLHQVGGSLSDAARMLGIGSANLTDFLQRDEELLQSANRLRKSLGLKTLGGY